MRKVKKVEKLEREEKRRRRRRSSKREGWIDLSFLPWGVDWSEGEEGKVRWVQLRYVWYFTVSYGQYGHYGHSPAHPQNAYMSTSCVSLLFLLHAINYTVYTLKVVLMYTLDQLYYVHTGIWDCSFCSHLHGNASDRSVSFLFFGMNEWVCWSQYDRVQFSAEEREST